MREKVKLTITVLDAEVKLPMLLLGFLSELGYSSINKKAHGSPGKLKFVFRKKKKDEVRNERTV